MSNGSDPYRITISTWNKIANIYQDKFMDLAIYNNSYDYFCNALSKSKASILEIGCGPGNITKYLLEKNPALKILATDAADNMIQLAKQNVPQADFELMDARSLETIQQTFDGLMVGFCLPYLSGTDTGELILASRGILNEYGILYLSAIEGKKEKSGFELGSTGDKMHVYYHNYHFLKNTLEKHHFEIIYKEKIPYQYQETTFQQHLVVIAQKKSI